MMAVIGFLILMFLANLFGPAASLAQQAAGSRMEELQYRLDLGALHDVALVHLRLTEVGPGRYRAEFAGAAQGAWSLLNRWLPERYETEMTLEQGRLKPLVYREEFEDGGHHVLKEYRFDYARRQLSVWRSQDNRELAERSQVPMEQPVYDPLTLFYNLRLGAFGPLTGGKTLKVALVPAPEPRELVLRLGPETPQGQQIMVEVKGAGSGGQQSGTYFLDCNSPGLPRQAWTRALDFCKLSGQLVSAETAPGNGLQLSQAIPQVGAALSK
ncbi:MAG: DUF3108 domain-containing protein [Desulfobaccales bacterium]